jgi:hypothetical protein
MTQEMYITRKEIIRAVEILEVYKDTPKRVLCCDGTKRMLSTIKAQVGDMVIVGEGRCDFETHKVVEKWLPKDAFDKKYQRGV